MPLNWNVKECKNYEALLGEKEWAATEVLIFGLGMLGCGGKITEKNAPEIFARLSAYEAAEGALRWVYEGDVRSDVFFTPADIEARVGLSTNWGSRTESRAVWIKRVLVDSKARVLAEKAVEYRNATAKAEVAA